MSSDTPQHQERQKTWRRPARTRRQNRLVRLLPALGAVLVVLAVAAVIHERNVQIASRAASTLDGMPVPPDVARNLSAIPADTWDRAGAAGAERPILVGTQPSPGVVPVVLYMGAEYCPYCAAMRWPLIAALNRFGTFTGLALSTSSATDVFPSTATMTFLHARYRSPHVALQTVELQGSVADASGQYPMLQQPTTAQATLFRHNNPSGGIPFLLIGGRYMLTGSPFSPALLQRQDWHAIAASLPLGRTAAARAILASANEVTAAICAVDGAAPATVCHTPGVLDAAKTLPPAGK